MLRFIHSADLQLGMPFSWVAGDRGARLRRLRFEVLDRLAALVKERQAGAVLLAGDVFDANDLEDALIWQGCEGLGKLAVPVYLLPGNHDHLAPVASVYERAAFAKACPPNVTVLREPAPVAAQAADGTRFLLLPAPLRRRRETGDTTAWWSKDSGRDLVPDGFRVGIAHGGVIDFEFGRQEDGASNFVDPRAAERAALDYVALGDWHGTKQVNSRTWYSGAPEPTGFVQNDPGKALVVAIERPGAEPVVESVRTASGAWLDMAAEVRGGDDIALLRRRLLEEVTAPSDTLVRLRVSGALSMSETLALDSLLAEADARLLHLRIDRAVAAMPSGDELDALMPEGWVAAAAANLRSAAAASAASAATGAVAAEGAGAEAVQARDALALLHRILAEARS